MKLISLLLVTLVFSGCTKDWKDTETTCDKNNVCALVIHEVSDGKFVVLPNKILVKSRTPNISLVWTFADNRRFEFRANSAASAPDGILFKGNANSIGLKDTCYATNETKDELSWPPDVTPYFRCDFRPDIPPNAKLDYGINFHGVGANGAQHNLDPTVETNFTYSFFDAVPWALTVRLPKEHSLTTGPATSATTPPAALPVRAAASTPPPPVPTVLVDAGSPVTVGTPPFVVTWSLAKLNGKFGNEAADRIYFYANEAAGASAPAGTELGPPGRCFLSNVDGSKLDLSLAESAYFTCDIRSTAPFSFYYRALFKINGVNYSGTPVGNTIARP